MKKLGVGHYGREVTELQGVLQRAGFAVAEAEVGRKFFGPSTRDAMRRYQAARGLPTSGELDPTTAASLMRELGQRFEPGARDASSLPAADVRRGSGVGLTARPQLGSTVVTNRPPLGSTGIGTTARPAEPALGSTGIVGTTARPAEPVGGAGGSSRRVSGTIALEHGSSAAGATLRIYQRGFGGTKTLVGEGRTDEQGRYDVAYASRGAANIELHAVGADGVEVQLSKTMFGAGEAETIDLVAPSKLQPPEAEFTRLTAAVSPSLDGNPSALKSAVERGSRRDLTLLAGATGWDARVLALAAEAHTTAEATAIPVEGAYALARLGLPTAPSRLARVPMRAVEGALRRAADAGIIEEDAVAKSIAAFETFAGNQRLVVKAPGALSNAKDFLGKAARVTARDRAAFEGVVRQEKNGDVWARAKEAGVSEAGIAALKLQGKLAYLTANNAELTEHLLGKVGSDPMNLIGLGYYEAAAWKKTIREDLARNDAAKVDALVPPAFGGATPDERLDAYAEELARRVGQMDPHAVTLDRIAKDRFDGVSIDPGVKTFLTKAKEHGFRLGQTGLGAFLKQEKTPPLSDLVGNPNMKDAERERVLDGVRTLSALYAITPSDAALGTLLAAGFKSATQVAEMPYPVLAKLFQKGAKDGDQRSSEKVHWKAQQVAATVFNVFDGVKRFGAAISQKQDLRDDQRIKIKEQQDALAGLFPTLENLFGTVDFCACEECQSVLSPAAYLVDLLHFIHPKDWATVTANYEVTHGAKYPPELNEPFFYLRTRRPDIQDIYLTCENTNTALPYIDLVNEILERVVAGEGTGAIQAFDTGEASSADLMAEPQQITWAAYVAENGKKALRDFVYPPSLPFDLPLEMVRAFLKQLEIPLFRLRERVLRPSALLATAAGKADGLVDVWVERLGLGPYDVAALTRTQNDWYELFGYGNEAEALKTVKVQTAEGLVEAPAPTSLGNGKTLARRLGVTYEELVEILRTRFVNPGIAERVVLDRLGVDVHLLDLGELDARITGQGLKLDDLGPLRAADVRRRTVILRMPSVGCDFAKATLAFDTDPPDATEAMRLTLLKMSAFVRLRRKLGWDVHELDRALMALVPGVDRLSFATWDAAIKTALVYLAHVEDLVERGQGRVTREEVIGLWTEIPTQGVASLYERLFESPAVLGQDPVFASRLGKVLAENTDNDPRDLDIEKHVDTLRRALQLSHDEIERILSFAGARDGKVSVENLSTLRRHAVLAKLLGVSVAELIALLRLTEKKPLSKLDVAPLGADVEKDVPWKQTVAFLREVDVLKAAGLDVKAVERLCRHRGAPDEIPVESDPVVLALRALPAVDLDIAKEDPRRDEKIAARTAARREVLPQTLAAQLAAPPAMVKKLLGVLVANTGKPLLEDGFGDESAHQSSVRKLRKALDLIGTLGVTEPEFDHLLADPASLNPNDLPLAEVASDAAAQATFKGLSRWIELAAARKRLGSSERLLAVLAAAKPPIDALSALTGLPSGSLETVLAALAPVGVPDLATPAGVVAFVDALAAFIRIGLDPAGIVGWASAAVDKDVAQNVRAAVKGRYSPSSWRRVAQPIFDGLRKKQRDALVAHLTHVWDEAKDRPKYGDTQEKLFEHLLIDPGTEPIVLASRIQLAISSVQLFVRRCLMGLEEDVKPGIIDAKRWQWMQRYRVWEVNRKFFIWPENWLDPEFRDDKTHLFRELEGALLQGDVDDDLVRGALHKYLQGLEVIARLEMLTMYFEPGVSADGGTAHVIGRTQNAPYKYFHRSCTAGMWTPWEPIEAGIEGDHLVLTAWRGRMHLFWVSFFQKGAQGESPKIDNGTGGTRDRNMRELAELPPTAIEATTKIQLQLHWVEYVRGKWVNRSSTPTFEDAPSFDRKKATTPEEKKQFFVHAKLIAVGTQGLEDDDLEIHIAHADGPAHKFVMFSKLAPPRLESVGLAPDKPILSVTSASSWEATKWSGSSPLQVGFTGDQTQTSENGGRPTKGSSNAGPHTVLDAGGDYRLLFPSNERLQEPARRLPAAVGTPSPVVFRPQDAVHIVYRGADRSIHDLWGDAIGWFLQSPSADAEIDPPNGTDPEPAYSDPHAYSLDERGLLCIDYAGKTTIVELSFAQADAVLNDEENLATGWLATTIYAAANEHEYPVGKPLGGIFAPQRGCVFRTESGRLLACVEDGAGWKVEHLNATLPAAASDPTGCLTTRTEFGDTTVFSRHVVYLGQDGNIHALVTGVSASKWTPVNATAGLSAGDLPAPDASPWAYASPSQEIVFVVYRAAGGAVREISRWVPIHPPPNVRLSLAWRLDPDVPSTVKAKRDPVGFAFEGDRARHVVFHDEHDKLHELRRPHRGQALISFQWSERDVAESMPDHGLPVASVGVVAYEAGNRALLCYADEDGALHALRYSDGVWTPEDLGLLNPFTDVSVAALATPFFYESARKDHTFFVEPHVVERAVHEWTEWVITTEEYVETSTSKIKVIPFIPDKVTVKPSTLGIFKPEKRGADALLGALVRARGSFIGPSGATRPDNRGGGMIAFDPRRGSLGTTLARGGKR